jgi:hypothetical protein
MYNSMCILLFAIVICMCRVDFLTQINNKWLIWFYVAPVALPENRKKKKTNIMGNLRLSTQNDFLKVNKIEILFALWLFGFFQNPFFWIDHFCRYFEFEFKCGFHSSVIIYKKKWASGSEISEQWQSVDQNEDLR